MRVGTRRHLVPLAVVVALSAPMAPAAIAASTPTPQRITGQVQEVVIDQAHGRGAPDETVKVLRVNARMVPLTPDSLPGVKSGTTVTVTVVPGADGAKQVVSSQQVAQAVAPPVAAGGAINKSIYIALVSPAGSGQDPIQDAARTKAMATKASSYWKSQTDGQVAFTVASVHPWYQSAYDCSDVMEIWNEALAKIPEAYGPNKHLVVVSPPSAYVRSGCPYGLGTIGSLTGSGNAVFVSDENQSLYAHELGHNLGLYHSNSLRCSGTQDMPMVHLAFPGCQANPYDDLFDVMGYSGANYGEGDLNAVHLDGMGLLPRAVRKIPANPGVTTVRITPLSAPLFTTTTNRTLKITDPTGATYFVEYRTRTGRDGTIRLAGWTDMWGVRVLRDDPTAPPSAGSYELDATPTSLSRDDYTRYIPVGGTFTSASRRLTIRVAGQDATGATLTITNWAAAVVPGKVTLSVPTKAGVGSAITASTRVTDRYGKPVAYWTVALQKMQKGTKTWRTVTSLRTNPAGTAAYRFANGVSGYYRWVASAAAGAPARISPSMAVASIAQAVERRPATSVARRRYLWVYGSISSIPAPVVYLQYRYRWGTWRTAARATVRGTTVSGRISIKIRTTVYTRWYVRPGTSYVGAYSNYYATKVI